MNCETAVFSLEEVCNKQPFVPRDIDVLISSILAIANTHLDQKVIMRVFGHDFHPPKSIDIHRQRCKVTGPSEGQIHECRMIGVVLIRSIEVNNISLVIIDLHFSLNARAYSRRSDECRMHRNRRKCSPPRGKHLRQCRR